MRHSIFSENNSAGFLSELNIKKEGENNERFKKTCKNPERKGTLR